MPDASDGQKSFDAYVRSNRVWLHREAHRLCGDWHEAEDLVQATLQKICGHWEHLTRQQNLAAYARKVLLNTYISERRRSRWSREIIQPEMPERVADVDLTSVAEDRVILLAAINRLGRRQRLAIILRIWCDISAEHTASILQCSTGTVTSQTNRALRRLRALMTDQGSRMTGQ